MNMQALMRQAQNLQKDMLKVQEEIEKTTFDGESSLVKVKVNGKKEVLSIEIDKNAKLETDDIELLEDMLLVALNNTFKKVDNFKEQKMSKFGNIPGIF
ncbi:MAG: YbaB/EbfC family nucleoid-associated protein [Bacilli bacterium]|nr:YbaB/EbfC family nucleoid-associated protein [Bacilli bacterium]